MIVISSCLGDFLFGLLTGRSIKAFVLNTSFYFLLFMVVFAVPDSIFVFKVIYCFLVQLLVNTTDELVRDLEMLEQAVPSFMRPEGDYLW